MHRDRSDGCPENPHIGVDLLISVPTVLRPNVTWPRISRLKRVLTPVHTNNDEDPPGDERPPAQESSQDIVLDEQTQTPYIPNIYANDVVGRYRRIFWWHLGLYQGGPRASAEPSRLRSVLRVDSRGATEMVRGADTTMSTLATQPILMHRN